MVAGKISKVSGVLGARASCMTGRGGEGLLAARAAATGRAQGCSGLEEAGGHVRRVDGSGTPL
eukprot:13930278-Alexandrium_andersonii.AAC.1